MPRQRSSGRNSSSSNKSDIEENQERNVEPEPVQVKQQEQIKNQEAQVQHPSSLQSKQQQKDKIDENQNQKSQQQTQLPNRYTLYRQSFNFNWNMKDFDINKAVQQFGKLDRYPQLQDSQDENSQNLDRMRQKQGEQKKQTFNSNNEIKIKVLSSNMEMVGISKKTTYILKGKDKNGQFQISRFYNQFVLLRQKLVLRWPGCFIPPVPTKKFGNNPYELMLIRIRFLKNFVKKLCNTPEIYYGQQCQIFFNHITQAYIKSDGKLLQSQLQKIKATNNNELLQKYKEAFSNVIQDLTEQQQSIAITEIKQLEAELKTWKVDLTRFKDELKSLINIKDKYYQAMTRLSTVLLPEYQDIILGWINGDEFQKKQQGKQTKTDQREGYLLNTQEYGTALKDTALSVRNYNDSLWLIYDIFKYELKQTDAILQAIQSYEYLVRQKQYLTRNISINKDQLQSLDEKKTTLKIFIMSGTVDEKRDRIHKESQGFEQRLSVVKELLNFVLNVLINTIDAFHNDRAQSYRKILAKSSQLQLVLVKKLMDFHIFELEIFKRKDIFNKIISQDNKDVQISSD